MATNQKPVSAPVDNAAILAEIAALRAENEALKASKARALSIKVSAKGAVSLYGLGKWPVTLYREQWTKVFDKADEFKAFFEANKVALDKVAAEHANKSTVPTK